MCLATAYWSVESDQPILKDIAYVRLIDNIVELETLLGEKKVLQGKVQEIDFMSSTIIMEQ